MKAGKLQTRDYSIIYFNPQGSLCPREQKRVTARTRTLKPVLSYARHFAKGRRFVILDSYTKAQLHDTDAQA
jgi:hypothetical protein